MKKRKKILTGIADASGLVTGVGTVVDGALVTCAKEAVVRIGASGGRRAVMRTRCALIDH